MAFGDVDVVFYAMIWMIRKVNVQKISSIEIVFCTFYIYFHVLQMSNDNMNKKICS